MANIFDEFERMERRLVRKRERLAMFSRQPASALQETEKAFTLRFEMPGVERKDIALEVTQNSVRVHAEKREARHEARKGFYRAASFSRVYQTAFTLPSRVIPERVEAKYENGVLTVTLLKAVREKVALKKVKVK